MRQSKNSFRHESLQDGESIADILKALDEGFAKGKLSFSDEGDEIVMRPEGLLNLKLTAVQEEGRHRVTLRVTWQVEQDLPKKKKALKVSTK